ncbi:MAG TPA: RNA polymerase sigma factor [Terracidiphilus sp.]|jgi:RNA polymerase sigma-70 factor (ECF subfamily)|nr:RNA polymerase sigma factor [Terracidiphilus sp.]
MNTTGSTRFEERTDLRPEGHDNEHLLATFLQAAENRRPQLLQVARRITNRIEDAEDVLQEAFLKAYRALPRFRGDAQMSTWLTAIVKNTALEHLRGQRGRVFLSIEHTTGSDNEVVSMDFPDARPNPEESCERRETEALLHTEVSKLNRGCRQVIERCVLQEQSQSEVAEALQVRVATIKARVFRAKRSLNVALSQYERSWGEMGTSAAVRTS